MNPYEISAITGLTLDQVILAEKDGERVKAPNSKYSVFMVEGYLIGYVYKRHEKKNKKNKQED